MNSPAAGRVDEGRLWQRHLDLAEIGATPKGGVNRQALTPEEVEARKLLAGWAVELGLEVLTDDIGNVFLRRDGSEPDLAPVLTGSHLRLVEKIEAQPAAQVGAPPADGSAGDLRTALERLSFDDQEVLRLVAWEGLSHAEAGQVLSCSTNAVGVRIHRARKRLEVELERVTNPIGLAPNPPTETDHHRGER